MQSRHFAGSGLLALLLLGFLAPAMAQFTTSDMAGTIRDDAGNPVASADVVIVHEPTGTRRTTSTGENGRFQVTGLRVGGPYTVTVTKSGYAGDQITDIYVTLKDTYTLSLVMESGVAELDRIQVTGDMSSALFSSQTKGTQTIVTRDQIEALPTIERSLNDYVRLDPRAVVYDEGRGEISIAGQNSRYNNITIDNVPTNDEFGLNANGLPSRGNVISIDAIQEIEIDVAPYDVAKGQFVGGGINAITKSGGNEFFGSVYYLYRDEDMVGDDPTDFPPFEEETIGFNVGGPIIKDKLFFFLSYEEFEVTEPGPDVGLPGSGAGNIFDLPPEDLQRIISAAQNTYGFDPGQIEAPGNLVDSDELYLGKIDWNISDNHRAQFSFQRTEGTEAVVGGRSPSSFSLGTYWYNNEFERDAFSALLFSDWTDSFATEFNVSYADYRSEPIPLGQRLPQVEVITDAGDVLFGTEQFRHANLLETEVVTLFGAGTYFMGNHTLKFGFDYKENSFDNTFVFASQGVYQFASIEDWENNVVNQYTYRIGNQPGDPFPAADWSYSNLALFAQDTWEVTYDFSLTYGVRVDIPTVDDSPLFNPLFLDTYGFRNDGTIDGNEVIQPRVGFNWDLGGNVRQQLRGGLGLFQGSTVGVWLSNPFTNPGGNVDVFTEDGGPVAFTPDIANQPRPGGPEGARQDVDVLDPDFEPPTVWRGNLAYDRELPWGVNMTLEVVHSEVENAIQYEHLNLGDPTGTLPDGRNSYYCDPASASGFRCNADPNFNDVLLLTNTGKGSSTQWTAQFSKTFGQNLEAMIAYTYNDATEVNPGTSSRAISNWNNRAIFNPNEDVEATANYEIKERIIGTLTWRKQFFNGLDTTVGLFYEGRTGRPFSFTFDNDANGDRIFDNDLLYVPSGPGDVLIVDRNGNPDPAAEQDFFNLINQTPCLARFKGSVVTRNHCRSQYVHSWDLRVAQEIPFFFDAKGEVYFNILNLGNLIDEDWGIVREVPFEFVAEAANFQGLTEDGRYIMQPTRDNFAFDVNGQAQSRWSVQLGLRVNF